MLPMVIAISTMMLKLLTIAAAMLVPDDASSRGNKCEESCEINDGLHKQILPIKTSNVARSVAMGSNPLVDAQSRIDWRLGSDHNSKIEIRK